MNADQMRRDLLAQHERIRNRLATCAALAQRIRGGETVQSCLDDALADLRQVFAEHNELEGRSVSALLDDSPAWGRVLVDRMLEEHVAEHAVFWQGLAGSALEVAVRMDDLVDELEAHMAAEERTFLSPSVLRDDEISRRKH